jgi:hypothetical protein
MTNTIRVDVEHVRALKEELASFNSLDLSVVEFYDNGNKLEVSEQALVEWKYVGLNNADFIMTGLYKEQTIFTDKLDIDDDEEDDGF